MNLESSEVFSLFPFGICQILSTVSVAEEEHDESMLLSQLSTCFINLLGAKPPNNTVSVLPRGNS